MTEAYSIPKPMRRSRKARKLVPRVFSGGKRSRVPDALRRHRALEKQADELWRRIVRSRGDWCERCHWRPSTQAHHLVSRRYRSLRWITRNGANLCAGCHMLVGQDGDENRLLAEKLIGAKEWAGANLVKSMGRVDPALAIVALREEGRARRLATCAICSSIVHTSEACPELLWPK